jgi:hypothetical protein
MTPYYLLLAAVLVGVAHAQAGAVWKGVRGAELRAMFIDHELADGVHYAYQFWGDGTFTGFNMGKEIHGTWRLAGSDFCWTQRKSASAEECFEVERRGSEIRFLRDGYEALSAVLSPVKDRVIKDTPR